MVSDQEIVNGLDTLLRQSDPIAVTTLNGVVEQLGKKLGLDLTHKAGFIRDQINLIFRSHPKPQPQPHPPAPPPKDHFALQHQHPQFRNAYHHHQQPQIPSHFALLHHQHQQQQQQQHQHQHDLNFSSPVSQPPPPQHPPVLSQPPPQAQTAATAAVASAMPKERLNFFCPFIFFPCLGFADFYNINNGLSLSFGQCFRVRAMNAVWLESWVLFFTFLFFSEIPVCSLFWSNLWIIYLNYLLFWGILTKKLGCYLCTYAHGCSAL